ncbi:MAG TPA: peptidase M20, partial [Casimicrobium sp.]|nr:peptidase M20 [Casimicrobium sp.]
MTARPDTFPFNADQSAALLAHATKQWDADIVPQLIEYVKLPAKSPAFEAEWKKSGQIQRAIDQAQKFVAAQPVKNMTLEVITLEGRTPVLFFDIPGTGTKATGKTVLLYGHLDKQPEMAGWRE